MTNQPKDINEFTSPVERIERFQSLQSGEYWVSLQDIVQEGIKAGTVLLIQSIKWVDNQAHTIILRPHPSMLGKSVKVSFLVDGDTIENSYYFKEHRFRINDFMNLFAPEPDGKAVRARELQEAQDKIMALQGELVSTPSNANEMNRIIQVELDKQATAAAGTNKDGSHLPSLLAPMNLSEHLAVTKDLKQASASTMPELLATSANPASMERFTKAAEFEHKIATIKADWIIDKTKQIAEATAQMMPFFEEMASASLAATEDTQRYIQDLIDGIASLGLYTGKDVMVDTICEGKGAAQNEPLTFMQRKLLMNQELVLWADVKENFDFSSQSVFFEKLQQSPELIAQIFPTERCIVVMATTLEDIDYKAGILGNAILNERNKRVFMLVRNGENIHRINSPVETHLAASRLFPSKNDQDGIFGGVDGTQINFDDLRYTDRLESHERFALHYKRFLILICGLDHRLKLFGDFYPGEPDFGFITLDFQQQYCRFLFDDQGESMIGDRSMPSLQDWINAKNSKLCEGSLLVCSWYSLMTPENAPSVCKRMHHRSDAGVDWRYSPSEKLGVSHAKKRGEGLVVNVEVSGCNGKGDDRTFLANVTLSDNEHFYGRNLPYLVLDNVSEQELVWYLNSRTTRVSYYAYVKLFKFAIPLVRERDQLLKGLVKTVQHDATLWMKRIPGDHSSDMETVAWQAVRTYYARRRSSKPLDVRTMAQKVIDEITLFAVAIATSGAAFERHITELEASGNTIVRLCVSTKGDFIVYALPQPDERDDRLIEHGWITEMTFVYKPKGFVMTGTRQVYPENKRNELTVIFDHSEATHSSLQDRAFSTPEHKAEVFDRLGKAGSFADFFRGSDKSAIFATLMEEWLDRLENPTYKSEIVQNPVLTIPIAVRLIEGTSNVNYLSVTCHEPHVLLMRMAPSEDDKARIKKAYVKRYGNKEAALRFFQAEMGALCWSVRIGSIDVDYIASKSGAFWSSYAGYRLESNDYRHNAGAPALIVHGPDIMAKIKYMKAQKNPLWFDQVARDIDFNQILQVDLTQIPYFIRHYRYSGESWFDIGPIEHYELDFPLLSQEYSRTSEIKNSKESCLEAMGRQKTGELHRVELDSDLAGRGILRFATVGLKDRKAVP